jgi:hypothetical protein
LLYAVCAIWLLLVALEDGQSYVEFKIRMGRRTLTWRPLHGKQPFRDFLWGLRVLALSMLSCRCEDHIGGLFRERDDSGRSKA